MKEVLKAISYWSSIQEISFITSISSKDVVDIVNSLVLNGKARTKIDKGKLKYCVVEKKYNTLDEFMIHEIKSVSKDKVYSSEELANTLLESYPESPWGSRDILENISKFVRIGSLEPILGMNGNNTEYQYTVR